METSTPRPSTALPILMPEGSAKWAEHVAQVAKKAGFSGIVGPDDAGWHDALTENNGISIQRFPDEEGKVLKLDAQKYKMATTNPRLQSFAFDKDGSRATLDQFDRTVDMVKQRTGRGRTVLKVGSMPLALREVGTSASKRNELTDVEEAHST